jgi:wyosine [tRNA(Phe)-imidazoG37] synthetase (radical SAM superfamily)
LGISLGVNLLPRDGKVCSFDCLYCECGWNADHRGGHLPDADEVMHELETKLQTMHAAGEALDVITFAGNGEPTLHPDFPRVIERTLQLRDQYYPEVKVSVLSNATQIGKEAVRAALLRVDNNILKIDGAFDETVHLIDQPADSHYSVRQVIEWMKTFQGQLIVQTMFVRGEHNGQRVDNTTPQEVAAWCDLMREVRPHQIMVYSLDRPTPEPLLTKVSKEEMTQLVAPLLAEGFNIQIV